MKSLDEKQRILENMLGIPFTDRNLIEPLKNGDEIFPAMLQAIREAEERVDFLTFVYWSGDIAYRFADTLSRKALEGVEVRVILDSFGAAFMPAELAKKMKQSGVQIEWFRPIPQWKIWKVDNRTHRKILICDQRVGFAGGVGIAGEWEGDARNPDEWRETHFRIRGPAVSGLHAAFMENWAEAGRRLSAGEITNGRSTPESGGQTRIQVLRTSASVRWSDIMLLYQTLVAMTEEKLRITTAYFNPDPVMVELLAEAARSGVRIEIMMPGRHIDRRVAKIAGEGTFDELLEAGVRLWYYQKTMLHSKIITIDGVISCIGSANFNHRSMHKDDEINLVVIDPEMTGLLDSHFEEDLQACEQVEKRRWKRRNGFKKGLEAVAGLFRQQI